MKFVALDGRERAVALTGRATTTVKPTAATAEMRKRGPRRQ